MNPQSSPQVDLAQLFGAVTKVLEQNRDSLNSADTYNQNHGDNMVDTFNVITNAVKETSGRQPSEQLAYASQRLSQQSQSGSAQLYSQGLANAAGKFQNQSAVTPDNAMQLVQALLGGQSGAAQSQSPQTDMLSGLLGTLMGGQTAGNQSPSAPGAAGGMEDLLGSLLGGQASADQSAPSAGAAAGGMEDMLGSLLGGGAANSQNQSGAAGGIDLNTLLTAGMAFFQARQQGAAPMEAIIQALMSGSQMNASAHRSQSGQLVAQTLINTVTSMLSAGK